MPREPSRAELNKLEYVAQKPAFLANFGQPTKPAPGRRDARDLPSRPKDGEWAGGSDGESEDEWEAQFGGGDDGPQIVVLKEGRHLTKDEVERERKKGACGSWEGLMEGDAQAGSSGDALDNLKQLVGESTAKAQGKEPPPPAKSKKANRPTPAGAKRKLVGDAVASADTAADKKTKKKKKVVKGLLSFDEAEGEA
ncbi:hypothetical protein Q8F55_000190 [Vanrija albida]|uniref:DUF4604 domain-containing protein n=1 Tax=Vanrija albida TaxID=181172 RepID=A0ABR3QCS1_9TREE